MKKNNINFNLPLILQIIKGDKKNLFIYSVIFAVIGVIVALGTPKTYKASVMLAPEETGSGFSGSLSSLASMVGMNLRMNQTGDAIYPEIYPDLISSINFNVNLLPISVRTSKSTEYMPYYTYVAKYQKIPLLAYPQILFTKISDMLSSEEIITTTDNSEHPFGFNPFYLTIKQAKLLEAISKNIECSVDKKTNVISITVTAQDPLVAAIMADSVKSHLQIAITDYRTKKAKENLIYMERLYSEAKSDYDNARRAYATAVDSYKNISMQVYQSKIDDLESEKELKYQIYQQVVEQLQIAKSILQEKTPAFTVLQNPTVPSLPSSRSRKATVAIWLILGVAIRCTMLAWKNREKFIVE